MAIFYKYEEAEVKYSFVYLEGIAVCCEVIGL